MCVYLSKQTVTHTMYQRRQQNDTGARRPLEGCSFREGSQRQLGHLGEGCQLLGDLGLECMGVRHRALWLEQVEERNGPKRRQNWGRADHVTWEGFELID